MNIDEEIVKLKEENEELKSRLKNKFKLKKIILLSFAVVVFLVIIVFICNYIAMPYIKLIGDDVIEHEVGKEYVDPGYESLKGKNLKITIEDLVDVNHVGDYEFIYKVNTRSGKVFTYKRNVKVLDKTAPTINVDESNLVIPLSTEINDEYLYNLLNLNVIDNYDDVSKIVVDLHYDAAMTSNIGSYEIKIVSKDSSENSSEKIVKIEVEEIKVTGINTDKDSVSLVVGSTADVVATVSPSNATNQKLSWYSENDSIATVDLNGKITSKSAGNTKVCARSDANFLVKKCVDVYVKNKVTSTTSNKSSNTNNTVSQTGSITVIKCEFSHSEFTHSSRIDASIRNDSNMTYDFVKVKFYTLDGDGNTIDTRTSTATDANFAPGDVAKVWVPTSGGLGAKCAIDGYSRVH